MLGALSLALVACGGIAEPSAPVFPEPEAQRASPERPACDRRVQAGADLQAVVDEAAGGAVLCLEDGTYAGPLVVDSPVTLWGTSDAVIRTSGEGTTVEVLADGTRLLGFTVDGSGGRFDTLDAAVRVEAADVEVTGLLVRNAVFGLLVEKATRVTLRGNEVHGPDDGPVGMRGDPIRMWETTDSVVEGNRVIAGRDVVIWYSSGNRIADNVVEGGRYGTHFMYSHHNTIVGNRYRDNIVGIFLMYSRDVRVHGNVLARSGGSAGVGLGLKESGELVITDNAFVHNTLGCYVDTSPLSLEDHNRFERNVFAFGDAGIVFHATEERTTFRANSFLDNRDAVRVEGRGHARDMTWTGNHFDDYAGYDLDGDGYGDVPFELRSLSGEMVQRRPKLAFLEGTAALWLVDAITHIAPLLSPETLLVDPRPAMESPVPRPTEGEVADAR
ncbi:MAG: nitrous oxide reductase family maturation protein NosD [Myxococcota bacterium]